jgi:hypothetical protein
MAIAAMIARAPIKSAFLLASNLEVLEYPPRVKTSPDSGSISGALYGMILTCSFLDRVHAIAIAIGRRTVKIGVDRAL